MLRIHFTGEDLARTTIAREPDPLWEVLLSLHLLQSDDGDVIYGRWRRRVRSALPATARPLLDLAPPTGYSPDFLTPARGPADLDDAVDGMLATPRAQIGSDLDYLATRRPMTPWVRRVATADRGTMHCLGHAIRCYHRTAIAPYWRSIRSRLALDRTRRGGQLAQHGVGALLAGLNPRVRWQPPVLEVLDFADTDVHLDGRGLTLVPSYFCWQTPTKLRDTDLPPVLVYPITHTPGELVAADADGLDRGQSLAALLGRTRAAALEATGSGCTTTELARTCGISLGTASHQATVLREAGLITTRRIGGAVRHEVTPLGARLLDR